MTATTLSPVVFEQVHAQAGPVRSRADALKDSAKSLRIANATDANIATEFLARVAKTKKDNDAARRSHTDPLNAQVKEINAAFKAAEPLLDEADQVVRNALGGYMAEQERLRREAEQRLAEQRRQEEAAAETRRRELAEEAARRQREADEAERARVAALSDELSKRYAAMDDDDLAHATGDGYDDLTPQEREAADRESVARIDARRAAQEAQAAADAARIAELTIATAPVEVVAPAGPMRSPSGLASMPKRWTAEVLDERAVVQAWLDGKVPAEFVSVNASAIGQYIRAAKDQHTEHPGITYMQIAGLSVRTAS